MVNLRCVTHELKEDHLRSCFVCFNRHHAVPEVHCHFDLLYLSVDECLTRSPHEILREQIPDFDLRVIFQLLLSVESQPSLKLHLDQPHTLLK
jgi:hypothetical protein